MDAQKRNSDDSIISCRVVESLETRRVPSGVNNGMDEEEEGKKVVSRKKLKNVSIGEGEKNDRSLLHGSSSKR